MLNENPYFCVQAGVVSACVHFLKRSPNAKSERERETKQKPVSSEFNRKWCESRTHFTHHRRKSQTHASNYIFKSELRIHHEEKKRKRKSEHNHVEISAESRLAGEHLFQWYIGRAALFFLFFRWNLLITLYNATLNTKKKANTPECVWMITIALNTIFGHSIHFIYVYVFCGKKTNVKRRFNICIRPTIVQYVAEVTIEFNALINIDLDFYKKKTIIIKREVDSIRKEAEILIEKWNYGICDLFRQTKNRKTMLFCSLWMLTTMKIWAVLRIMRSSCIDKNELFRYDSLPLSHSRMKSVRPN